MGDEEKMSKKRLSLKEVRKAKDIMETAAKSVSSAIGQAHADAIMFGYGLIVIDWDGNPRYLPIDSSVELCNYLVKVKKEWSERAEKKL